MEIHGIRNMLRQYHSTAERSLFFVNVDKITVTELDREAPSHDVSSWSLSVHREDHSNGEPYILQRVSMSQSRIRPRRGSHRNSNWYVVRATIDPDSLPPWAPSIISKHKLKRLSIALAARIPSGGSRGRKVPAHYFFSSLPLPTPTSLPAHVHASFILADDRRNIRWDGNDAFNEESKFNHNEESKFNHWLLNSQLPSLFLYLLEVFATECPRSPSPWPGNASRQSDPFSLAVINGFYSDNCLASSTRNVFRSLTGRVINPVSAVVRGPGEPGFLKDLLHCLQPDDVVELPSRVCEKAVKLRAVKKMDQKFVCNLIKRERSRFVEAYETSVSTVESILQYLVDGLGSSLTLEDIVGLPLLPLANNKLSNVLRSSEQTSMVYSESWIDNNTPWPIFSAKHFLHPSFDGAFLIGQGFNVASFDTSAVVRLLQTISITQVAMKTFSPTTSNQIMDFWELFPSLPIAIDLSRLQEFALVPITDAHTFISLKHALGPSIISTPALYPGFSSLVEPLRKLGVIFIQSYRPDGLSLPLSVAQYLPSRSFTFTRVVEALNDLSRTGDLNRSPDWSKDAQVRFAGWISDELENISIYGARKKILRQQHSFNVLRSLPIWPSYRGNEGEMLRTLTDPNVRILPGAITVSIEKIAPLLTTRFVFVKASVAISRLGPDSDPMSLEQFASCLAFPPSLTTSQLKSCYEPFLNSILQLPPDDMLLFSSHLQLPRNDLKMEKVSSLYSRGIPEFQAAFEYQPERFIHPSLASYQSQLHRLGLKQDKSPEAFEACCQAVDKDFNKTLDRNRDRAKVVYQWYNTELPVTASTKSVDWWRQLDAYAFVPTRGSTRRPLNSSSTFRDMDFALLLPLIVPPSKAVRNEYASVAWTQRALFLNAPDKRLLMTHESIGVPSIREVVSCGHRDIKVLTLILIPYHLCFSKDRTPSRAYPSYRPDVLSRRESSQRLDSNIPVPR